VNGGLIYVPPCNKRQHIIHGQCAIDYVESVGIRDAKCPICGVSFSKDEDEFTPKNIESLHKEETSEQSRIERAVKEHEEMNARIAEARANQERLDSTKVEAAVAAQRAFDERTFDIAMQNMRLNGGRRGLVRSSSQGRNLFDEFNRAAGSENGSARPARPRALTAAPSV
jgi:uncharacterized protein YdcH (DUF465 family)